MRYGIDFDSISIQEFYRYIKSKELMKSHKILKEDMKYYQSFFLKQGYKTIQDLYSQIKTKSKVVKYSKKSNIDVDYLVILRRHLMSFIVKSRRIGDFKHLDPMDAYILEAENITNTKELFFDQQTINRLHDQDYILSMLELITLRYISPVFAEGLYFAGYKNIYDISVTNPEDLRDRINKAAKEYGLFKSVFGLKDSKHVIDDAVLYLKWQDNK